MRLFALRDPDSWCGVRTQLIALQNHDLCKRVGQRARGRKAGNSGADYNCSLTNYL